MHCTVLVSVEASLPRSVRVVLKESAVRLLDRHVDQQLLPYFGGYSSQLLLPANLLAQSNLGLEEAWKKRPYFADWSLDFQFPIA